ncbi:PREDICTED: scale keratin-like, partial [Buceros rhinoceros silvestris]|uniref:scale keratin-like n=1 Tax=Buceros rhinoceros silvestris TaxID=175836 RepID=UPI00052837F6
CGDSRAVVYGPPVVITFPGPILSTYPQESLVGTSFSPSSGALTSSGSSSGMGRSFGSGSMLGMGGSYGSGGSFGSGGSSGRGGCYSRRSYTSSCGSLRGNCGSF